MKEKAAPAPENVLPNDGITDTAVLGAIRYMKTHLEPDLNVAKLARQIGISPPNLRRRFREAKQPSPLVVLAELRMARATELLAASHLTLKEIANLVGYRTSSAFGKAFLRAWGTPPGSYRRLAPAITHTGHKRKIHAGRLPDCNGAESTNNGK